MPQYRVTVQELNCEAPASPKPEDFAGEKYVSVTTIKEVFAQTFPATEFDLNTLVLALNKRRRIRKSKKDASS